MLSIRSPSVIRICRTPTCSQIALAIFSQPEDCFLQSSYKLPIACGAREDYHKNLPVKPDLLQKIAAPQALEETFFLMKCSGHEQVPAYDGNGKKARSGAGSCRRRKKRAGQERDPE